MRSRQPGWIMPEEDIPSMLRMIEKEIASSEIEFEHQHALIWLRDILEQELQRMTHTDLGNNPERSNQEAA